MFRFLAFLCALTASLWASTALANGGGYAFGVKFTGGVSPFQASGTEGVQIVEEQLDIQLRRMDAAVVVRYSMRNPSDDPVKVRFGFPVEASLDPDWDSPREGDSEYAKYQREHLEENYQQLRNYQVSLDGAPVKAEFAFEPFARGLVKPFPGSEVFKSIAGWMISEATFPPTATVILEIRYAADHFKSGIFVSEDDRADPSTFVYRLSTGAVWRGPIAKGTVTIRADGIPADEVEIVAPRGRFKRDSRGWTWSFKDLKPTLADDITVRPTPAFLEVGAYSEREKGSLSFIERAGAWGMSHQRYKAKASSTLPPSKDYSYDAKNVGEENTKSPWCEGVPGNGVGEWLQLSPAKAAPLLGIGILPGVVAGGGPELFKANGSPTRIEVLLNDDHRFVATLGDKVANQFIPVIGYGKPVSKMRLTLLEARPGSKFEDTCITRVLLYDRLKQQPEMRGAR
jgi:uncharacterized protein DUF4424